MAKSDDVLKADQEDSTAFKASQKQKALFFRADGEEEMEMEVILNFELMTHQWWARFSDMIVYNKFR